jgi:hypothetical protein
MSDIVLHIERLVLEGIPLGARDAGLLHAAVERELARLLSSGAVAPALLEGGAMPRLAAPSIALQPGIAAGVLGQRIAGAVYRGMGT